MFDASVTVMANSIAPTRNSTSSQTLFQAGMTLLIKNKQHFLKEICPGIQQQTASQQKLTHLNHKKKYLVAITLEEVNSQNSLRIVFFISKEIFCGQFVSEESEVASVIQNLRTLLGCDRGRLGPFCSDP